MNHWHTVSMARPRKPLLTLPPHVHRVVSRGREYFTFQKGRGTKKPGPASSFPILPIPNSSLPTTPLPKKGPLLPLLVRSTR